MSSYPAERGGRVRNNIPYHRRKKGMGLGLLCSVFKEEGKYSPGKRGGNVTWSTVFFI